MADWYLIISFLFIFAVLLEYTVVLYLTDREGRKNKKKQSKENNPQLEKQRLEEKKKKVGCMNFIC